MNELQNLTAKKHLTHTLNPTKTIVHSTLNRNTNLDLISSSILTPYSPPRRTTAERNSKRTLPMFRSCNRFPVDYGYQDQSLII